MPSISDALVAGLFGLIPGALLFCIFVAWRRFGADAAAWFAKWFGSPTASVRIFGIEVRELSIRGLVEILPPLAIYLGFVWLLLPSAAPRLSTFGKPSQSAFRLDTIVGKLLYKDINPTPQEPLIVRLGARTINWRKTIGGNEPTPFVIPQFPVDDSDPTSTLVQFTQGCMQSDSVSLSPDYYDRLDIPPKVTIESPGKRRLETLVLHSEACTRIKEGPIPRGQTAALDTIQTIGQ